MSVPFLLEIGVEEVPDWMIEPALQSMRELFTSIVTEHRLSGSVTSTDATPRRLVLRADGLLASQPDVVEIEFPSLQITAARYDAGTVGGTASIEPILDEPFSQMKFTPAAFPGLF